MVGVVWPVQVIDNQVVMVRTKDRDGHFALQIGAVDNPKLKNVSHLNVAFMILLICVTIV